MTLWTKDRESWYTELLTELLKEVDMPDVRFAVSFSDGSPGKLGILKVEGRPGQDLLMIPRSLVDFGKEAQKWAAAAQNCTVKRRLAVFRGSTSPGCIGPDNVRYQLAKISQRRPDLLDAGFTSVANCGTPDTDSKIQADFAQENLTRPWMTYDKQQCYSALVV